MTVAALPVALTETGLPLRARSSASSAGEKALFVYPVGMHVVMDVIDGVPMMFVYSSERVLISSDRFDRDLFDGQPDVLATIQRVIDAA